MLFPRSNAVIVLSVFFFMLLCLKTKKKPEYNNKAPFTFNSFELDRLVDNDSLFKAAMLVNEAIEFSKKHRLKHTEAKAYNAMGTLLAKMSNYKKAEAYHNKAYHIFDSLQNNKGKDLALAGLVRAFIEEKNYKKFDSIYPIAEKLSKSLNSEVYFINLNSLMKRYYYTNCNDSLLSVTKKGMELLSQTDFCKLNISKDYRVVNLKEKLALSYKYFNGIAKIKKNDVAPENYKLILSINDDEVKYVLKPGIRSYRKLATLNYYKYLYFTKANKNLDSAAHYLLKSDSYKYQALAGIDKESTRKGELVYKIINAEQKLNLTKEIQKKEAKNSKTFLISTIIVSLLFIVTLVSFFFYFKAKKNIEKMNEALKASNDRFKAIDKERLEFFSILSHELRTPIYGISGLATLIDQENDKTKKQNYLDSLISSSNYLSILIDNVLQANRLKFEKKSLRLKPGKIKDIVNYVVGTVAVAAKNKGLDLKVHIDESDEKEQILIDKVAFSQILINLAYNAIRYTKEGCIKINVFEKKRTADKVTLRIEVQDTGIGIKEEHRSLVFSAFENKTFLHKNSSGSGLGLHIVKTLLECHNSDIDFVSIPNKGTCFFFEITFDLYVPEEQPQKNSTALLHRNMRVLVVDDNKINLLITKKNIEKIEGYSCKTVSNGKEAISLVKDSDFDLILMDINMPDMDGYDVTKHIRMFNSSVPILALTALNSNEILKKAEKAGINHILTKPYIFDDFKAVIMSYANNTAV